MADQPKEARGITAIAVSGFKSLRDESRIEIRNLTVLAGANSSGKSSIMQPLLLLKQTLEAPSDPGPLKLDGPNVIFTEPEQFLSHFGDYSDLMVQLEANHEDSLRTRYTGAPKTAMEIVDTTYRSASGSVTLTPHMKSNEISDQFPQGLEDLRKATEGISTTKYQWDVVRNRCFLNLGLAVVDVKDSGGETLRVDWGGANLKGFVIGQFIHHINRVIYLAGFRGNPQRNYPVTAVTATEFPGRFEYYTASVIADWFRKHDARAHIDTLVDWLYKLGLTSGIGLQQVDATQIELRVNLLLNLAAYGDDELHEMVSIADVGFGVSQVLPVLVALLVAEPGQLVYIEQPELHLHPRAQVKLAEIIADAANRGVRVVIETHSDLLILGIQTLVAEGKLATDKVILHWFTRSDEGITKITPTTLDETGAFQDAEWPEDFAEVRLDAQSRFLDAADIAELTSHNAE